MQEAAALRQLGQADPSPHSLLPSTGSDYSKQHHGPAQLLVSLFDVRSLVSFIKLQKQARMLAP